jgi:Spy/CpxP family protein refolding chaperone
MSHTVLVWLAALVLAAPPGSLGAQQTAGSPPAAGQRWVQPSPVERLLQRRDELALTADQVVRLQAVNRRMQEANRPLVQRLLELRSSEPVRSVQRTPEQHEAFEARVRQARPLMQQIRENNRSAMREVGAVLTDEQKAKFREHLRERREKRGGRDGKHPERRRGQNPGG